MHVRASFTAICPSLGQSDQRTGIQLDLHVIMPFLYIRIVQESRTTTSLKETRRDREMAARIQLNPYHPIEN